MKLLKAVGILTALVVLAKIFVFPDYRHRFRLTIEFDTPDGVKSASAVHEVVRKDVRWILIAHGQYEYRFHGEAIFLDLGRGKHVVALLAHGRPGDGRNGVHSGSMTFLGVQAYATRRLLPWEYWVPEVPFAGVRDLPTDRVPTLVTFPNVLDPSTVRVIDPFDGKTIEETYGMGYAFRRATIEAVPAGVWPFDILGIYGEPITKGLESRLSVMLTTLRDPARRRRTVHHNDPFRMDAGYLVTP